MAGAIELLPLTPNVDDCACCSAVRNEAGASSAAAATVDCLVAPWLPGCAARTAATPPPKTVAAVTPIA